MTGDGIEALGGVAEGTAIGHAVERDHGALVRGGAGHFEETACLNCSATIEGNYCRHCGQAAHLHRTMGAFLHDLLHGVLHLDGKTWRTLPLLAFRPGRLTRAYIDGKRASYVSPMALFLFAIFAMFAVFSFTAPNAPISGPASFDQAIEKAQENRDMVAAELAALDSDDPDRARLEAKVATLDDDIAALRALTLDAPDELVGAPRLAPLLRKWRDNPSLMIYKLQSTGYKFSWLLIPLSLPFVWLLFAWRRRYGLYDHAVFVTYSIAFMSLLFLAASLLGFAGISGGLIATALILIVPLHIFSQLRGTYGLSRFGAAWRTVAVLIIAFIVALLFLAILVGMGGL
ncbi:DUF3667 domain-containing protein [Croceicoccus ponticola]|uniref:DUF3667 domain-containing protein n=2 Tax=Croceicoccus ponticola TaxID=2217664 RepID=A0A437GYV7_9SPHN|nr:DUF3667 domain-containing protein [Croceicoccus ponticola]